MNKKMTRLSVGFSVFLLLCTVINFVCGNIGAAACSLGAGFFYACLARTDGQTQS